MNFQTFFVRLFVTLQVFSLLLSIRGNAQCVAPPGAILIESGPSATVDFSTVATVGAGKVYYTLPGTITTIDHTGGNLTVSGGGKIMVMENSILYIQMGGKNMTVNGGILQLCNSAQLLINPGHDFTMNGSTSLITLGNRASMRLCNFGHDITLNAGTIEMNDYASVEFGDYHNVVSNATNLVKYIGAGNVGIASGDPIFHTGGSDFVTYSNTNNIGAALTNSSHIDFINDNFGSDNPGSAQYCGIRAAALHLSCRSQWGPMDVICGGAAGFQSLLSLRIMSFESKIVNGSVQLNWLTSEEKNVDHFEVERSDNLTQYSSIGRTDDQNTAGDTHQYFFTDKNNSGGKSYYRLKVIDKDGRFMYSAILPVSFNCQIINIISCTPNPFSEYFQLKSNFSNIEFTTIEFFSMQGNVCTQLKLNIGAGVQTTKINGLSSLPKGIYVMKISNKDGNYYQRMIKE
jgi:hypothetical protein